MRWRHGGTAHRRMMHAYCWCMFDKEDARMKSDGTVWSASERRARGQRKVAVKGRPFFFRRASEALKPGRLSIRHDFLSPGGERKSIMLKYLGFTILLAAAVSSSGADNPELVIRGQIKLTLAGAERVLLAARGRAAALSVAENIAVVDDGGHLLAFARMDGARPASADTAITKAVSAAIHAPGDRPGFQRSDAGRL